MQSSKSKLVRNGIIVLLIPSVIFLVLLLAYPQNISLANIPLILSQAIAPAILAWGVSFCLISGNWDFSIGAAQLMAAIIGGRIALQLDIGFAGVAVFTILAGFCCGLITALVFYVLRIPTIIVTVGMMLIYESLSGVFFDGFGVSMPPGYLVVSKFPNNFIVLAIVFAVSYYLHNFRKIGYHVRAVGNNAVVASLSGIDVYKIKATALVLASTYAGIYAMYSLGLSGTQKAASNMQTSSLVFDSMMCVFLGMALQRLCNLVIGIYIGSVTMQLIRLTLLVFGFPSQYNQIIIAVFVLVFMAISYNGEGVRRLFEWFSALKQNEKVTAE